MKPGMSMRKSIGLLLMLVVLEARSQNKIENIIVITTDGFRWQELFQGMDSAIANNPKYNQGDSTLIFERYWAANGTDRRRRLLPFFWSTLVSQGQVYGNRILGNKVDNANPYWFSYPGYSEIMTGYADTAINANDYPPNPNTNVLEFLNKQPKLKGKVAAFGAWDAFDRILNEKRSGFPVISAFDIVGGKTPNMNEKLINAMKKDGYRPFNDYECLDVFMHYSAMEYLKNKKPRVLYIAYGETDEWAHSGFYRDYLNAAHQVDAWVKEIWEYVQKDPQYRNKTALLFTTDHGRGDKNKDEWTSHNNKTLDSHEIWFAVMGPGIPVKGEIKTNLQLYQEQFAQTIAKLLGYWFKADHPVADPVTQIFK
jgi:hypothetical protein